MATRRRLEPEQSRALILDAVDRLIRREGSAAISTRRVAAEAGLKPPLVHYYYPTLDDLLLAYYRRAAEEARRLMAGALTADRPIHTAWERVYLDGERAELSAEFLALAVHRPAIRDEMAAQVDRYRDVQLAFMTDELRAGLDALGLSPDGLAVLLGGVARALIMEERIGISRGHAAARAFMARMIDLIARAAGET